MDQPGKVANPARGQLNRENNIPLSPCVLENLVSQDGFSRSVPRQPAHLHTQAESGAYLRDSSRVPRRRPFMKPPYAIGSVPSLSGHATCCRKSSVGSAHTVRRRILCLRSEGYKSWEGKRAHPCSCASSTCKRHTTQSTAHYFGRCSLASEHHRR